MSDVVECFLVRPSSRARRGLRRYVSSLNAPTVPPCTGRGYHDAIAWIDELHVVHGRDGVSRLEASGADQVEAFAGDPRWPAACAYCTDYAFLENDERQIFWEVVWERADDPRVTMTLREPLPGAMYYADWYGRGEAWSCGPDGRALIVVTPDRHPWHIDGTASNCDWPCARCGNPYHAHQAAKSFKCEGYQPKGPHKCWVRHGVPPLVTVDKNGVTCNAGGGSIQTPRYHGFLRNGRLERC